MESHDTLLPSFVALFSVHRNDELRNAVGMRRKLVIAGCTALALIGGAAAALMAYRFVVQQRSQSAYLAEILVRTGRIEADLARTEAGLARVEAGLAAESLNAGIARERIDATLALTRQAARQLDAAVSTCTIIATLPIRIDKPGSYCIEAKGYELARHQDAITVLADDVSIDLRGRTIQGHNQPDTISAGIYSPGYRNLIVRNGTIAGFFYGIRYDRPPADRSGGGTVLFQDLVIRDSKFRGVSVDYGPDNTGGSFEITGSTIDRVGGNTAFKDSYAMGIEVRYTRACRIFQNRIIDVYPVGVGEGVGISFTADNGGCVAEENYILNSRRPAWGRTIGVWPGARAMNPYFFFARNVIYNYTYAFMYNSTGTTFTDNVLHSIDCSPANNAYYARYAPLNKWYNENPACTDSIQNFEKAATEGDARAQYRLATVYWEGTGTPGVPEKAWYWFRLAERNGSTAAKEWIERQASVGNRGP